MLPSQMVHVIGANAQGKGVLANLPKIYKYSYAIAKMTKKLKDLYDEYPKKIKETAQQVAVANMMECKDDFIVNVTTGNEKLSFFFMPGTDDNEKAFISFADPTLEDFSPKKVFGPGTDDWIVRKGPLGFWRVYKQTTRNGTGFGQDGSTFSSRKFHCTFRQLRPAERTKEATPNTTGTTASLKL